MEQSKFTLVMPMSGRGTRFSQMGIKIPKPQILLSGVPIWGWSFKSLPIHLIDEVVIVEHHDYPIFGEMGPLLTEIMAFTGVEFRVVVEHAPRNGAAQSVLVGLQDVDRDKPLVVANCDQVYAGADTPYTPQDVLDGKLNGLIPCFTAYDKSPKWSYVETPNAKTVAKVIEKPANPPSMFATIGVYYFRAASLALDAIDRMMAANDRVNGEYYFAPCYNYLDHDVMRPVGIQYTDTFYGIGTPEDVDAFVHKHRHLGFELNWKEINSGEAVESDKGHNL
jgi:dTDP-glucose pyrophosphorylase